MSIIDALDLDELRDKAAVLDDLLYLAAEAFDFDLQVNPHAGGHEWVDEWLAHFGDDRMEWISEDQRAQAYATGRFICGQVYPVGSVSFYWVIGTNVADVVSHCARFCREDRARYLSHSPTPTSSAFEARPLPTRR